MLSYHRSTAWLSALGLSMPHTLAVVTLHIRSIRRALLALLASFAAMAEGIYFHRLSGRIHHLTHANQLPLEGVPLTPPVGIEDDMFL